MARSRLLFATQLSFWANRLVRKLESKLKNVKWNSNALETNDDDEMGETVVIAKKFLTSNFKHSE